MSGLERQEREAELASRLGNQSGQEMAEEREEGATCGRGGSFYIILYYIIKTGMRMRRRMYDTRVVQSTRTLLYSVGMPNRKPAGSGFGIRIRFADIHSNNSLIFHIYLLCMHVLCTLYSVLCIHLWQSRLQTKILYIGAISTTRTKDHFQQWLH